MFCSVFLSAPRYLFALSSGPGFGELCCACAVIARARKSECVIGGMVVKMCRFFPGSSGARARKGGCVVGRNDCVVVVYEGGPLGPPEAALQGRRRRPFGGRRRRPLRGQSPKTNRSLSNGSNSNSTFLNVSTFLTAASQPSKNECLKWPEKAFERLLKSLFLKKKRALKAF